MSVIAFPMSSERVAMLLDDAHGVIHALHTMLQDASTSGGMSPKLARIGMDALEALRQQLRHMAERQPVLADLCPDIDRLLGEASMVFRSATVTNPSQGVPVLPAADIYANQARVLVQAMSVLARARQRLRAVKAIDTKAAVDWKHLRPTKTGGFVRSERITKAVKGWEHLRPID
ncbi:hypothetical protein [Dyella silvae]|uniref:hypothetical protein n=1 Tax=Dyella silvae TaxID=2994424 RepID=UPI0022645A1F|nr:hypothetical protein [Dyella silvae]